MTSHAQDVEARAAGSTALDSLLHVSAINEPFLTEAEGFKALSHAREHSDYISEVYALAKLAAFYRIHHQEDKAFEYITAALQLVEHDGSDAEKVKVLYAATEIYRFFNYHKEALDYGSRAMGMAKQLSDSLMIAKLMWGRANVHLKLGQKDIYFKIGEQALGLFKEIQNAEYVAILYTRLGSINLDLKKRFAYFDLAEEALSYIVDPAIRNKQELLLNSFRAIAYLDNKDYVAAESPTRIALKIASDIGNEDVEAIMHSYLSKIYFYQYQNYDDAISYGQKHLAYEVSISRYYYVIPAAQFLMEIYSKKGDATKALEYAELAMKYQDSLYWANRKNDADEVEQIYEMERKFAEVAKLKSQRRAMTLYGLIGVVFLLLLASFFYYQRELKSKHMIIQQELSQKLQADKDLIAAQNVQMTNLNTTKDRLFAIIGHDLRGPLFGMQGLADQIDYLIHTNQIDRLKTLGKTMERTTIHLTDVLNDVLDWSRLQMGSYPYNPEILNVAEQLEEVQQLFEVSIKNKSLEIRLTIDHQATIFADRIAFQTMTRNILSNAIKFSYENGIIDIRSKHIDKECHITIEDQGSGLTDEQLASLHRDDKRLQTKGTVGEPGTGIGLSIVKDLVASNKGRIQIDSKFGCGTLVTIVLPTNIGAN